MPTTIYLTEEQMKKELQELLHIVHNMRFAQKYWHIHFGSTARQQKEKWELKADEKLNRFGLTEHNNTNAVQVIRE